MPPKKAPTALKKQQPQKQQQQKTKQAKTTMLTQPKPRRSASRGRPKAQSGGGGGQTSAAAQLRKQGTVSKAPRISGGSVSSAGRRSTTARRTTNSSSPTSPTGKPVRRRFQPPPPPPMYWIIYDFTIKLIRGLCLGVAIGLVLTVVLPWMIDSFYEVYDAITEAEYSWPDITSYTKNISSSWNVTSSRIWRPDQESNKKGGSSFLRGKQQQHHHPPNPPHFPPQDPKVTADEQLLQNFPRFNRTITVVHVGHTGGKSLLQSSPNLHCREKYSKDQASLQQCLRDHIPTTPLARQAQYYFHLGTGNSVYDLQKSTSFLFTLRNPIDRIVAIYADSHPLACSGEATTTPRPWGCTTKEYWNLPDTQQYRFYSHCFPTMDAEPMAQAVKAPWGENITGENKLVTTLEQQQSDCRWMAREMVSGQGLQMTPLAPHMHYNYKYYSQQTILKFGGPEVLVVRAEQETHDLNLLHQLLDTTGQNALRGESIAPLQTTTSSDSSNIISKQAYAKLCCILEDEIKLYDILLQRAVNLPQYVKDETMLDLKKKCGLLAPGVSNIAWDDWRVQCKDELDIDSVLLTP